jgi:autotransporter-associated beta strand protein
MNTHSPLSSRIRIRIAVLLALAAGVALVPDARAQTSADWNNSSTAIGTNTSWTPNTTPSATFTGNFNNATSTNAPSATANAAFGKLYIGSSSGALTFGSGSNTITLSGVSTGGVNMGIEVVSGAGAVSTGSARFALAANQTWSNNSTNALTVGGIISGTNFGLTKEGTGTLVLSGANTFTGGLLINTGTVTGTVAGALGTASNTVTFGGTG